MAKGARGKGANIFVWIILGLLIVGLAGFGVGGFGGNVRSIGKVGDREITTSDYARALQQEIRAYEAQIGQPVGVPQALTLGIDRNVRAQLVTLAALDHETGRLGLSVGDDTVGQELLAVPAFQGLDGSFDREAYRFSLQQAGLSEREFEEQVRFETARTVLQGAVVGAVRAPDALTQAVFDWATERRAFSHLTLGSADLETPLGEPGDAELQAFYDANIDRYTRPETKVITYVWLTPDMLLDTVEVDEVALREAYDRRINEFRQPERRLVERLVFGSMEEAEQAAAQMREDEAIFDETIAIRDLDPADVDLGDVTQGQLGTAGEAVFALEDPGIAGPVQTSLGPAVFRVNALLAARETPFEEAVPLLRDELALDRARRVISDMYDDVEDALAGGATLEQIASETDLELGLIEWVEGMSEGIAGYSRFRDAAEEAAMGDFPETFVLEDGSIAAIRLEEIQPPAPRPLDEVVVQVIEGWEAAATEEALAEQAEALLAEDADLAALGYQLLEVDPVPRDGFVEGVPPAVLTAVFEMEPGERRMVAADGAVHLVQLDRIEGAGAESAGLRGAIASDLAQAMAQDVFQLFAGAVQREAGISLNEAAINAVHAQFR